MLLLQHPTSAQIRSYLRFFTDKGLQQDKNGFASIAISLLPTGSDKKCCTKPVQHFELSKQSNEELPV
ncbi:hypothetical protein [Edaphocola flava]|uniref:hypothetical protein n=1 Tax=Edaphocola flava TaxID=2499629 RepID=UPI00100A7914|nr:hypothetical protein [Edaphocola flava]